MSNKDEQKEEIKQEENKEISEEEEEDENHAIITKRIALIRHGQALHNVNSDNWYTPDNPLTIYGEKQVTNFREKLVKQYSKEFYDKIDCVISSPLLRALQTSYILFNGKNIPIYVSWHHTEIYTADCDCGSNINDLFIKYPHFKTDINGWNDLPNNGKNWWPSNYEMDSEIEARHYALAQQLIKHEKKCIAVVGHGNFFKTFTKRFGKEHFSGNAEVNWYTLKYQKKQYSIKHIHKISPPDK